MLARTRKRSCTAAGRSEVTDKIGEFARTYWPVIVGAVMVATAWGANTAQIGWVAEGNKAILAKLDKLSDQQSTFQTSVATTQALEQWNSRSVADLNERMRTLEARR